jgi:acyl-CoA synthetase (AMP-forming)/AMP-acid ligase II
MVNAFNSIYYQALYLGIAGSGSIFTGVNPGYTVAELEHHMRLTQPKLIIVELEQYCKTFQAAENLGIPKSQLIVFDHAKPLLGEGKTWSALLSCGERDWIRISNPAETVMQYASTSGTTGLPKMAAIPHAYHLAQAELLLDLGRAAAQPDPHRLTALPPFHAFATPIAPASVRAGIPLWIMRRFDADRFVEHVRSLHISETYLVPPCLGALLRTGATGDGALRSLRLAWVGGAACPQRVREEMTQAMHRDARILPVWGMTEAGWITAGAWADAADDASVGRALRGFEVRVVGGDGREAAAGARGELVVRAAAPMLGYLDNGAATAEVLGADGWLHTGDEGYVLAGRVFVTDRIKDIVKVRGWQVSPAEVEAALRKHGAVEDVAVVGVPGGPDGGDVAKAFVVLRAGAELDILAIKEFARRELVGYKVPDRVEIVGAIPKSATGKILRRVLREQEMAG